MRISTKWLLSASPSVMAVAICATVYVPAFAQAPSTTSDTTIAEVVVTASRIERSGYTAPTPTTVVNVQAIQQRAVVNIGDALVSVPAFRNAVTPAAGGLGNTGAYLADLRGLGPTRTLVLLDKGRLPSTLVPGVGGSAGTTDLNVIPTSLIGSVDVVTGGASAAYGSDAVAGVVNFQLNDRLNGFRGTVQYGQTRYGDAKDGLISVAGGTAFAGGRGHMVAGFEFNNDGGTTWYNNLRSWGRQGWDSGTFTVRPAGVPFTVLAPNSNYFGSASQGGLILTNGALKGLAFVPKAGGGVTTAAFAPGLGNFTTSLDTFTDAAVAANAAAGIVNSNGQQLRPEQRRYNALAKVTYDLTDHISVYVEPLFARVITDGAILARRDGAGAGPALTIAKDNVYLQQALTPAQLALVPASGLSIGYSGTAFGPVEREIQKDVSRIQMGAKGDFAGWKWDADYLYAQSVSTVAITDNFNNAKFLNALDAVSVGGQVVCRSAAAQASGCSPINILGLPVVSPTASSYIFGTATGTGRTGMHELAGNVQGEPFSTWAGPVSIGAGAEFRAESLKVDTDPLSQTSGWFSGTGPALASATDTVEEGYLEAVVPLAKGMTLAKSLDFNGAVRETNYSTSGAVTTWKVGLTWEPLDGVLFRTTRSRDIRAPNLQELYTPQVISLPLPADPRPGIPRPTNSAGFLSGGNPNLKPEESITQTVGLSYQPSFLRNFRVSVDYYDIAVSGAITSTSTQGVLNNCFLGGVYSGNSWCSLVTFANNDPVNGQIMGIRGVTSNVAQFTTRGLDIQASYRLLLHDLNAALPGTASANFSATNVLSFKNSVDVSTLFPNGIDRAGQTGAAFGGPAGLPSWLLNVALTYEVGDFGMSGNIRYVSKSHQNNGLIGPDQAGYNPASTLSISNNNVPAITYLDWGVRYDLHVGGGKEQLFFNIDNVFDQAPPLPAAGTAYYDLLGRTFKGGVRFTF